MVKITLKLFLLLILVAAGSLVADQAVASQDPQAPVLSLDDEAQVPEGLICEVNAGIAGGNDGDPDSAGTGLGFMGGMILGGLDKYDEHFDQLRDEMLRLWLENLVPQP